MNILLENYLLKDCKKRGIELGLWYVIYKNAAIEYYDIQYEAEKIFSRKNEIYTLTRCRQLH